jgi:hypothetical protein
MEITASAVITAAKSIVPLAKNVAKIIEMARASLTSPTAFSSTLKAIQEAVKALGAETPSPDQLERTSR